MTKVWRRTWRPSPVLVLEERADAGNGLYARWWERSGGCDGRWRRRALGLRLRARSTDPVDPAAERSALELGERMHRALQEGRDPSLELRGGRTVGRVLDDYLRRETEGLSPRHRQDLERAARQLVEVLGADTPWSTLSAPSGRVVWRAMATRSPNGAGENWATRVVEFLWRVGAWVALDQDMWTTRLLTAPPGWRQHLRSDWARLARRGSAPPTVRRPRYSEEEAQRLWAHLPDAAPQLRLLIELAAPALRLGQASRVLRSALDLRLNQGAHGLGVVHLPGARGKASAAVALDPAARRAVEDALSTWLSVREAAFRTGEIEDYALLPGRLVDERAPIGPDPMRPISPTALRGLHRAWEDAAGLTPRGLHALRRLASDMAARETPDPTIRDHVGAWRPGSGVRERAYRDGEDVCSREAAEQVRARVRARLRGEPRTPDGRRTNG